MSSALWKMRVSIFGGMLILLLAVAGQQKPPVGPQDPRVTEFIDNLKNIVAELTKVMIPLGLPLVYEADLSVECMSAILRLVRDLQQLEEWAVAMLDASVKFPMGLLDGTSMHLGEYDECLGISLDNAERNILRGQYCTVEFSPPPFFQFPPEHRRELYNSSLIPAILATNTAFGRFARLHYGLRFMAFQMGMCTPSTCSERDVQELTSAVIKRTSLTARVLRCETKEQEVVWTNDQLLIVIVLGVALGLSAVGSVLAWRYPLNPGDSKTTPLFRSVVNAFSVGRNSRQLFGRRDHSEDSTEDDRLHFLAGLRILGLLVLIFGFGFGFPYLTFWHKLARKVNHLTLRKNFWFGIFGNGTVPFETLIFSSGVLLGFQAFRLSATHKGHYLPLRLYAKVVFRSLWCNALCVGLFLLLPLVGDGPVWAPLVNKNVQVCRENAWRNFLFIQNYWPFEENCMFHTAVISIIVFCATVGTLIIWMLMSGKVRMGLSVAVLAILASCASAGAVNGVHRFPPALALPVINGHTLFEMFSLDLIRPYIHLCSYTIGLITGWLIALDIGVKKKSVKWMACSVALGGLFLVFYIPYNFPYEGDTYRILSALFAASYRAIWCLALAAFALLCRDGAGGFLGSLASWSVLVRLDQLTWHTYLCFPLVMFYYHGQSRQLIFLGYSEMFMNCFGFAVISFVIAYIMYVLFTAPARNISCMLCQHWHKRRTVRLSKESA